MERETMFAIASATADEIANKIEKIARAGASLSLVEREAMMRKTATEEILKALLRVALAS